MTTCTPITFTQYLRQELGLNKDCQPVYKESIDLNHNGIEEENESIDKDRDKVVSDRELNAFFWANLKFMEKELVVEAARQEFSRYLKLTTLGLLAQAIPKFGLVFNFLATAYSALYPQYDFSPLEVRFPGKSYFIYPQNTLHADLQQACSSYLNWNLAITAQDLEKCLIEIGNPSLKETGLPGLLQLIEERTVYVNQETHAEVTEIEKALEAAPPINLQARSAASTKDQSEMLAEHMQNHRGKEPPDFTSQYRKIYGAPLLPYPGCLDRSWIPVAPAHLEAGFFSPSGNFTPPLLQAVYKSGNRYKSTYLYFHSPADSINAFLPEKIEQVYSLVSYFKPSLEKAAGILHRHHPEIQLDNFRNELYTRISHELVALDYEDPWQDMGACNYGGCSLDFESNFQGELIGPIVGGEITNLPWLAASLGMPMERQGFGPAQVILGLALEAAQHPEILAHYDGLLSADDYKDTKAALRTILEKPVYSWALCYDFVLTELEETIFKDPRVRTPRGRPPFIQDEKAAREFSLLQLASLLAAYPENAPDAKEKVLEGTAGIEISSIWGDIYQIPLQFPSLRLIKERQGKMEDGGELVFYVVSGDLGSAARLQ